jgi:hypothetical protein
MPRVTVPPRRPFTKDERMLLEFARLRHGPYVPPPPVPARPPLKPWTSLASSPPDPATWLPRPGPALLPEVLMLERRLANAVTPLAPPPVTITPVPEPAAEPEGIRMRGLLGW